MGIKDFFIILLVVSASTLLPTDFGVVLKCTLLTSFYTIITLLGTEDVTVVRYLECLIPEFTLHGTPLNCIFRVPKPFYDHCTAEVAMGNR